ncbi:uncharacterized protein LOC113285690 [Papaver somniferum]|uniref:uncharacterized protein LOC113285690 n=1 Tax=Papaver somniferum TaxID=3469 RepID=UPI000E701C86|nr:uncharacterized protein LOC113285690 [Papaver somniferum]
MVMCQPMYPLIHLLVPLKIMLWYLVTPVWFYQSTHSIWFIKNRYPQCRVFLLSWLQLLVLPICTLNLYFSKSSTEERSGNRKRLQTAAINQALAKWCEPTRCLALFEEILQMHKDIQKARKSSKPKRKSNVETCRKKLSQGHYTAEIRILSSCGVALSGLEILHELQAKHPPAPPIIPTDSVNAAPITVSSKEVLDAIRSFPKGTSCGRDGLRAQHLLDALSGPTAAVSEDLLSSMAGVINLWLAGTCPAALGKFVASAPLTPLLKPDGGLRPIVVGTIWRRLCSKFAATAVGKEMANYLEIISSVWESLVVEKAFFMLPTLL